MQYNPVYNLVVTQNKSIWSWTCNWNLLEENGLTKVKFSLLWRLNKIFWHLCVLWNRFALQIRCSLLAYFILVIVHSYHPELHCPCFLSLTDANSRNCYWPHRHQPPVKFSWKKKTHTHTEEHKLKLPFNCSKGWSSFGFHLLFLRGKKQKKVEAMESKMENNNMLMELVTLLVSNIRVKMLRSLSYAASAKAHPSSLRGESYVNHFLFHA